MPPVCKYFILFQTLAKVSRSEHTLLEQAREVIQRELEEETSDRLRKIKRSVLEPLQGSSSFLSTGNMERRKKYISMTAAEVVLEVLTNAGGLFTPRMAKVGPQAKWWCWDDAVALSFNWRLIILFLVSWPLFFSSLTCVHAKLSSLLIWLSLH